MRTGKSAKPGPRSRPFNAAEHLRSEAEVAAYIEAILEDGDARAVPIALRTVAEALGSMAQRAD
jgi:DNA-binding phage protein